jgi:flagellar FliL protein
MADATETPAAAEPAAAAPKSKGTTLLIAIGVLGGVLGAVTGGVVLAPRFVGGTAEARAAAPEPEEREKSGKGGKGEPTGGEGRIVRLDNMIVNPAGSEGTRFLMVSVAFEVQDAASEKKLKEHEVELRDMVVGRLESLTMPMLTRPTARDTLKAQLGNAARGLIGSKAQLRVFLPQFVIQ